MTDHSGRRSGSGALEVVFVDLGARGALLDSVEEAQPRISPADHARAATLTSNTESVSQWRRARIATRIVLERTAGPEIRKADFAIAPDGRPSLPDGMPYFNIAHSGGACLIAVSHAAPVGVDLERVGRPIAMAAERRRRIIAAARRLKGSEGLAGAEHSTEAALAANGEGDQGELGDEDVLRAWVRLEAAAKALGTGIGRLLTEEGVVGGAGMAGGSVAAAGLAVKNLDVPQGYVAAIAADRLPAAITVAAFPRDGDALAAFLSPIGT